MAISNVPPGVTPGDFFCVQGGPATGPLIEFLERRDGDSGLASLFQHAGIVTAVGRGADGMQVTIMEARSRGAVEVPYHYRQHLILWSTGTLAPAHRDQIVAAARGFQGVGYGWLDYLALTAHHYHLPAPGLKSYIGSTRRLICSQLVDKAWELGGDHIYDDGRWPGYVKPADLAAVLLAKGAKPLI